MSDKLHKEQVVLVPRKDVTAEDTPVPFIGTDTGIIGIMLTCMVVLIALGQILTGEDG